eukprot:TRINITY_DN39715_c0_g1_i1.p2 TRINITY_DN39715_c0_g1~~TRINITY_DN39715_c0_g1_i1.p2  ORF type:complete len:120 (-),score=11.92 TRINITY_DN39715_c0_g1_i1:254-613(-)
MTQAFMSQTDRTFGTLVTNRPERRASVVKSDVLADVEGVFRLMKLTSDASLSRETCAYELSVAEEDLAAIFIKYFAVEGHHDDLPGSGSPVRWHERVASNETHAAGSFPGRLVMHVSKF